MIVYVEVVKIFVSTNYPENKKVIIKVTLNDQKIQNQTKNLNRNVQIVLYVKKKPDFLVGDVEETEHKVLVDKKRNFIDNVREEIVVGFVNVNFTHHFVAKVANITTLKDFENERIAENPSNLFEDSGEIVVTTNNSPKNF